MDMIRVNDVEIGGAAIAAEHIRFATADRLPSAPAGPPPPGPASDEAATTRAALVSCAWNRAAAARTLGISYETLRWRIRKHGLRPG